MSVAQFYYCARNFALQSTTSLESCSFLGLEPDTGLCCPWGCYDDKGRPWGFGKGLRVGELSTLHPFLCREIGSTNRALLPWLLSQRHKYNKACCPLEGIKPSPQQVRPGWCRNNPLSCPKTLPPVSLFLLLSYSWYSSLESLLSSPPWNC